MRSILFFMILIVAPHLVFSLPLAVWLEASRDIIFLVPLCSLLQIVALYKDYNNNRKSTGNEIIIKLFITTLLIVIIILLWSKLDISKTLGGVFLVPLYLLLIATILYKYYDNNVKSSIDKIISKLLTVHFFYTGPFILWFKTDISEKGLGSILFSISLLVSLGLFLWSLQTELRTYYRDWPKESERYKDWYATWKKEFCKNSLSMVGCTLLLLCLIGLSAAFYYVMPLLSPWSTILGLLLCWATGAFLMWLLGRNLPPTHTLYWKRWQYVYVASMIAFLCLYLGSSFMDSDAMHGFYYAIFFLPLLSVIEDRLLQQRKRQP